MKWSRRILAATSIVWGILIMSAMLRFNVVHPDKAPWEIFIRFLPHWMFFIAIAGFATCVGYIVGEEDESNVE